MAKTTGTLCGEFWYGLLDFLQLDLLSGIAQIQECSSLEFCGEDRTYWRYIFEGGRWKEQNGKLVYEDCEVE